jgi:alpha-mannosidase
MITVHVILNAHIDPIWLWPWQSGLDTILNTCRSVCDLLDRNPDAIFTCGEAWKYRQIQRCDPVLFERIKGHIVNHRWEYLGWWIQPDCNLPSGWAMERQIRLGLDFFEKQFGSRPTIGFNVDSFGHAATLPKLMRDAGQSSYVMMRPKEHEKLLPARIFRWRGREDEEDVTVFRIARSYCESGDRPGRVLASMTALPEGITDTMVFIGVGDHGGGPSQRLIDWCRQNANAIPGAKLVFSSPSRFFSAIASHHDRLPMVTGELQYHAVGCYSVHRPIKLAVRTAEHLLLRAEHGAPEQAPALQKSWEEVCFSHFHDTLGGTCIPSAYIAPEAQLGGAIATADDILQTTLRREMAELRPDPLQRLIAWNPGPTAFNGYVSHEPWIEGHPWDPAWRLLNSNGHAMPLQIVSSEAAVGGVARLLFHVDLPANAKAIFRIDTGVREHPVSKLKSPFTILRTGIRSNNGFAIARLDTYDPRLVLAGRSTFLPHLELLDDPTDTWSHEVDRYTETAGRQPRWSAHVVLDRGPILASVLRRGQLGKSIIQEHWRIFAGEPFVELFLRVGWLETHKILKLVWPMNSRINGRIDGVMGGWINRALDGAERPLRDFTCLTSSSPSGSRAVVCPHVFAMDATHSRLRLTLLRSPLMAHHTPHPAGRSPEARVADWGTHEFVFRFFAAAEPGELDRHAMMLQRPPIFGEWTGGMLPNGR